MFEDQMWPSAALLFNIEMSSTKSRSILAVQAKMEHCVWDVYYRLYSRLPLLYNIVSFSKSFISWQCGSHPCLSQS